MAAFVRIVETGSFAAAAEDLGLTASAASKLLARLEGRLGAQLITRTTRRHTLTAEGEIFLAHARDILASIEAAEAAVTASRTRPHGHLRVNVGTALGRYRFTRLLPSFLARHPGITIDLGVTDRQIDPVAENVDVVIRSGPLPDSSLVVRKLGVSRRVICASPDYLKKHGTPLHPADLADHNCLLVMGGHASRFARWPFRTPEGINRLAVSGDVTSDSAETLIELAIAGHGVIRMLEIVLAEPIRQGLLVTLAVEGHDEESIGLSALMPPGRNRLTRVQAFLDFLAQEFGKDGEQTPH